MRANIDLHIHSSLSACADNDMTPNNIVNMAWIKGLDIIAVTDHNSAENCSAILQCASERGILAIPGMEVETREEIHVICLFLNVESALEMQDIVWKCLPDIKNRVDIFGEQLKLDSEDNITGEVDHLLLTSTDISIEDVFSIVRKMGGIAIPAHIDRQANSMMINLGDVPEELKIKYIEISKKCNLNDFLKKK